MAARGPWGRPIAKVGLALGAIVFLSWLGARSAASSVPPGGELDQVVAAAVASTEPAPTPDAEHIATAPAITEAAGEPAMQKQEPAEHLAEPTQPSAHGADGPAAPPPVGVLPDGRVVINAASAAELCRLPGIGPSRAERIIQLRQKLGGFKTTRQLLRVKGIGPRTLKRLEPLLVLDAPVPAPVATDPKPSGGS
ncbi:MAG: helix-hairpin-helix domain-containing protein [Polyangiaceae bacterium]|nr:helix-hairpin-helix domain-containing protein [Polyangiaceae bacterium]